jgi:putative FmdB family regulatory protein
MPLYDYRCPEGHLTEVLVTFGQRPDVTPCATCGALALRQFPNSNWQIGSGPQESLISRGIRNVRRAEREGRLDPPRPGERVSR